MGLFSFGRKTDAPRRRHVPNTRTGPRYESRAKSSLRVDPLLPEKQRARYRLVGAILLVLIAFIVLLRLLDPPSQPDTDEIEVWVSAQTAMSNTSSNSMSAPSVLPTENLTESVSNHRTFNSSNHLKNTASRSHFAVQAGVFAREQDARIQFARLKKVKLPVYLEWEKQGGHSRFLVQVGPFSDSKQAAAIFKQLRAAGFTSSQIEHRKTNTGGMR